MILFLHGEDAFRLNERRVALQKAFVAKYPDADIFVFDFEDQGTPDDVRRALGACEGGLFAQQKMVVFLHPFVLDESGEKHLLHFLSDFVKKGGSTTLLFVSPEKIKKTHPLARFLLRQASKTEAFEMPAAKDVATLIKQELRRVDATAAFAPEALRLFAAIIGTDTARMRTELEKLTTFRPGGVFEVSDVTVLVGTVSENVIFEALDALARGDKKRATLLLHREAAKTEGSYPVLAMCAWQMRRLLQVREALDRGVQRAADIARETKLQPFAVTRMLEAVRHLSLARIKKGFSALADIDTKTKTGQMDPAVALHLFVWKF